MVIRIERHIIFALSLFLLMGCIKKYVPETSVFEDVLVVEAMLTTETKHQRVILTRSYSFEDDKPATESNAQVWIEDSNQNSFNFFETEDGVYISENEFNAFPNTQYILHIKTQNGKEYESNPETLAFGADINNLYVETHVLNNENGVQVFIDNDNISDQNGYYKYEYEETFKVKTPIDIELDFETINLRKEYLSSWGHWTIGYDVVSEPHTKQTSVCYKTEKNKDFILTSTNKTNPKITKFPIRFISNNDYRISEKYSILVKQLSLSENAYYYYYALKKLQNRGSVFIENQPGYVQSNIHSQKDESEKVVGYFSVSQVSSKRIFFSYENFSLTKPPYPYSTYKDTLDYRDATVRDQDPNDRELIYDYINNKEGQFIIFKNFHEDGYLYYIATFNYSCDCTTFSSNVKPEFWED